MNRDDELREELEFHLSEDAEELRGEGLAEKDARLAALRGFGNLGRVQEETRAVWAWTWIEQLGQDLRYALRTMSSNRGFAALAVLSLALGIGANTAIFSFMDAILLRSLPVAHPEQLVRFTWHTRGRDMLGTNRHHDSFYDQATGFTGGFFSSPAFDLFRRNDATFSAVFGYQGAGKLNLLARGDAQIAKTEYVTGGYFSGLGVPPAAGRLIAADDDRAGAPSVAVISYALSQGRFGGPAQAVGEAIRIGGFPFTIVGVAPPEFFGADPAEAPDIYVPMHANLLFDADDRFYPPASIYNNPDYDWVVIMARLRPGVSLAQAQAALAPQFAEFERNVTTRSRTDLATLQLHEGSAGLDSLRRTYSKPLYVLLAMVGLILAIACANVANLLLARAAARRREIAVRLSMGAGRRRVVRQLLTESLLLAMIGGALGIAVAVWSIRFLTLLLAEGDSDLTLRAQVNWHVLAAAAGLSVLTGVVFGLAPALQATRVDLLPALKESRTGERRGRFGLSRGLVVSQIAFTMLILVAAGLFARTLSQLESIQLGFNRESLLTFRIDARQAGHVDPEILRFYEDLKTQFAAIPGVKSATLSNHPLIGAGHWMTTVTAPGGLSKTSLLMHVGPDFFSTMQIPIVLGRAIDGRDTAGSRMAAVVNRTFAERWFGKASPIGQHITTAGYCEKCTIEIVGVCGDARYGDLKGEWEPTVFFPYTQAAVGPVQQMVYELRTAGNPLGYVRAAREIVHRADARIPLDEVTTQAALINGTINQEITFARLCGAFAVLALAIACVGLYGTMSYNVARRTGEIGIRMALGAPRRRVVRMVLSEVALLVTLGLAISVPAAVAGSKLVKSFLFGTEPGDPVALAGAVAALVIAAAVAGYLPARRASRIDPVGALRWE
jgi:predicted permease